MSLLLSSFVALLLPFFFSRPPLYFILIGTPLGSLLFHHSIDGVGERLHGVLATSHQYQAH
jgi:hypothetical protein